MEGGGGEKGVGQHPFVAQGPLQTLTVQLR